ncbi:MAG: hypothetical protein ACR2G6_11655 [Gemmatimonadaceae bacterium]
MIAWTKFRACAAVCSASALLAGCNDSASPTAATMAPSAPSFAVFTAGVPTNASVVPEHLKVCKYGSTATIYVEQERSGVPNTPDATTSGSFALNDGDCHFVADFESVGTTEFVVRETASQAGFRLDSIRVTDLGGNVTILSGTNTWTNSTTGPGLRGFTVEFFNSGVGCTNTIGYWKNHDGSGPQPDVVTALLPVTLGSGGGKSVVVTNTTISNAILSRSYAGGSSSNGISKLYAQLLAAKLNIKRGADGSAVAATILAADNFLYLYNQADWSSLSKAQQAQVNAWMTTLDNYNNGIIGPGHCI